MSHVAIYRGDDRLLLKSLKGPKSHTNTDTDVVRIVSSWNASMRDKYLRDTKNYGDATMKSLKRLEETKLKRFNKWEKNTTF